VKYSVELSRKAEKDLDQLDRLMEKQVREKIKKLSLNPLSHELSQQVKMGSGERKTRVRDWRIFFEVDEVNRKIVILAVRHRSRAY
jgi:mRNA-degrading endonuclease RelE of RelBE toxin-antitoxin system